MCQWVGPTLTRLRVLCRGTRGVVPSPTPYKRWSAVAAGSIQSTPFLRRKGLALEGKLVRTTTHPCRAAETRLAPPRRRSTLYVCETVLQGGDVTGVGEGEQAGVEASSPEFMSSPTRTRRSSSRQVQGLHGPERCATDFRTGASSGKFCGLSPEPDPRWCLAGAGGEKLCCLFLLRTWDPTKINHTNPGTWELYTFYFYARRYEL
jgi:hypothetical protein